MAKSAEERERERLKRLRESQLSARDPGPKVKRVQWNPDRTKRRRQQAWIVATWKRLSPRARGAIVGVIFGMIGLVPSVIFLPGWYKLLGLPVFVLCVLGGMMVWTLTEKDK